MGKERRKYQRFKVLADIVVGYKMEDFDAVAFDVSIGGINIVTTRLMMMGDLCSISITKNKKKFNVYATIRWIKESSDKKNIVYYGLEFNAPITEIEMDFFM
jgi:hypothetical protein